MGYCPHVYRESSSPLYLPVPLESRTIAIPARISKANAPLNDGTFATAAIKGKTAYALNGIMSIGNPQNANDPLASTDDIYERIAEMTQFFLGRSSLAFTLVIAETGVKVDGFEFPPLDTDLIYTDCIALSFSTTWDISTKGTVQYSLNFIAPNRSIN